MLRIFHWNLTIFTFEFYEFSVRIPRIFPWKFDCKFVEFDGKFLEFRWKIIGITMKNLWFFTWISVGIQEENLCNFHEIPLEFYKCSTKNQRKFPLELRGSICAIRVGNLWDCSGEFVKILWNSTLIPQIFH